MSLLTSREYIDHFIHLQNDITSNCDDIKPAIQKLISETPISYHQIHFNLIVRTSVLEPGETCTNISRCTYNPDCSSIPLQRCNYAGQQIFYASVPGGMKNLTDGAQSSFMETCFDRIRYDNTFNERLIVSSRWTFKKDPFVWVLPFHTGSLELNENFKFLFEQFDKVLREASKDESTYLDLKTKAQYLSGLFCTDQNKQAAYKVTATFNNELQQIFNANIEQKINGIIYPSANTKGEGMNIALHKDFVVPENLICDHAVLYQYRRNPENFKQISFLPIAASNPDGNGELVFYPLPP